MKNDLEDKTYLWLVTGQEATGAFSAALSPDSSALVSAINSLNISLWDTKTGRWLRTLDKHKSILSGVSFSPDGHLIAAGAEHLNIRVWDTETGLLLHSLPGHAAVVRSVAWSPDGGKLASSEGNRFIWLWDVRTGHMLGKLLGHSEIVRCAVWSPDGLSLASGAEDSLIHLWDIETQDLSLTLGGHQAAVRSISWSKDGRSLVSGADDLTIRVWDAGSGNLLHTLEGHDSPIIFISWLLSGRFIATVDVKGNVHVRRCDTWQVVRIYDRIAKVLQAAVHPFSSTQINVKDSEVSIAEYCLEANNLLSNEMEADFINFVSAKIVLVGESNVGKSCLALRLTRDCYQEQGTTHGMQVWSVPPANVSGEELAPNGERRELLLWDMGGQDEYKLIHQLFLHDTTLAMVLLDPTRGRTAFEEAEAWNLRLEKQLRGRKAIKLLVGTKMDEGGGHIDKAGLEKLIKTCGFAGYFPTSSKTGRGVSELWEAIRRSIKWDLLAMTNRPTLFQHIRDEINEAKEKNEVILYYSDLVDKIRKRETLIVDVDAIDAVIEQLTFQGLIARTRRASGEKTLVLQVGVIEKYAGSLILAARGNPRGVPAIEVRKLVSEDISLPGLEAVDRLPRQQEQVVLECVAQLLLEHGIALRHEGLLIFPSLFNPTETQRYSITPHFISVYYDFTGAIDNIYSSLIVRLATSGGFGRMRLWDERAEFEKPGQGVCGLQKKTQGGGLAHLDIFFSEIVPLAVRNVFMVFVEDHLRKEGVSVTEVLALTCIGCSYLFDDASLRLRIAKGCIDILCPVCEIRSYITEEAMKVRSDNIEVERTLLALKTTITERKAKAAESVTSAFKEARQMSVAPDTISILHLSDLHFGAGSPDYVSMLQPLIADIKDTAGGLGLNKIDYLVISGDLTNRASAEEFEQARLFISGIIERFRLSAERCVIVPGNHDQSWDEPESVFEWRPKRKVDQQSLKAGEYLEQGEGYLLRSEKKYPTRFYNFSKFYHTLIQQEYPLAAEEQCIPYLFPDAMLQFICLNSSWEIDEYFSDRASINQGALARGVVWADNQISDARKNGTLPSNGEVLRLAVCHHPVSGEGQILNDAFLDILRKANVRLYLHGHVHENRAEIIGYVHPRKVHVIGAGSFGASAGARPESVPRLYNVLLIEPDRTKVRVHTRCQRRAKGAWEGWPEWPGATATQRLTYYDIDSASLWQPFAEDQS